MWTDRKTLLAAAFTIIVAVLASSWLISHSAIEFPTLGATTAEIERARRDREIRTEPCPIRWRLDPTLAIERADFDYVGYQRGGSLCVGSSVADSGYTAKQMLDFIAYTADDGSPWLYVRIGDWAGGARFRFALPDKVPSNASTLVRANTYLDCISPPVVEGSEQGAGSESPSPPNFDSPLHDVSGEIVLAHYPFERDRPNPIRLSLNFAASCGRRDSETISAHGPVVLED